jgi:hypothetical protein
MALPIILAIAAGAAALGGIGAGVNGAVKLKSASDTMKVTQSRHNNNTDRLKKANTATNTIMDKLGKAELETCASFKRFTSVWEKIYGKPDFKTIKHEKTNITKYSPEELEKVSVGAGVLLGGLGGAAIGTAGGFAAAGATTSAVMALGTASTGTAIASLSGAAATNATLAALGGGAIAAGGGGIALGTTILGASTLGIGLLIGGVIFSISGKALSNKADKAYNEMLEAEKTINGIVTFLNEVKNVAQKYISTLTRVNANYDIWLRNLELTVNRTRNWDEFSSAEKVNAENVVHIVNVLYSMCQVKFIIVAKSNNETNKINYKDINQEVNKAEEFLNNVA